MPWFIKTERFTKKTLKLNPEKRKQFITQHKLWVKGLTDLGNKVSSGYLVDQNKIPGGGGFLVIEANSYQEAIGIIKQDPIILNGLVDWELHEWVPLIGKLIN